MFDDMERLSSKLMLRPIPKQRVTERGELLEWFTEFINRGRIASGRRALKIGFMARKLQGLELADLRDLKSKMRDRELNPSFDRETGKRRNGYETACKFFWWSLDHKKH